MTLDDLLVEMKGKLQIVKLNRPEVLNALREKTFDELGAVLDKFAGDTQRAILIINGVGDQAFSAGGDLKEMEQMISKEATTFARLAHNVLEKIESLQKPIVACARKRTVSS